MLSRLKSFELTKEKLAPMIQKDKGPRFFFILHDDPFLVQMAKKIIVEMLGGIKHFRFLLGSEVRKNWFEDEVSTPSLFGTSEHTWILQAQEIGKEVALDFIQNSTQTLPFSIFLELSSAQTQLWKEAKKDKENCCIAIDSPLYWEWPRFLSFLLGTSNLSLTPDATSFFLRAIKNSVADFHQAVSLIALHYPDRPMGNQITEKELTSLLGVSSLDIFEAVRLFSQRKFNQFFHQLADNGDIKSDELRQLAIFLQNHLLKMQDSSYLAKKEKIGRYDQEIMNWARLWKKEEIIRARKLWANFETISKENPLMLKHQLKLFALN